MEIRLLFSFIRKFILFQEQYLQLLIKIRHNEEVLAGFAQVEGESMEKLHLKHIVMEVMKLEGIGWHSVERMLKHDMFYLEQWSAEQLQAIGLQKRHAERLCLFLQQYTQPSTDELLEKEAIMPFKAISIWDEQYPEPLKHIGQPPWILFAKGRIELLKRKSIAMVGTRYPTSYGMRCTKQFSEQFSQAGITIVSGFANGVDTIAHKHAVPEEASTIAVLPSAIMNCYPANNFALYEQLAEEGLLLSESMQSTPIHPGQFHQRNRIIAGLSCATIIIEGEKKSGSMITARHAMDMDRELFAVPGSIYSNKSEGPNFLIEKGYARMLLSSQQLFEELTWLKNDVNRYESNVFEAEQTAQQQKHTLSEEEQVIYTLIKEQSRSINEIHEHTLIPFGQLNVLLLNLCIKQFIELQPGSIYHAL